MFGMADMSSQIGFLGRVSEQENHLCLTDDLLMTGGSRYFSHTVMLIVHRYLIGEDCFQGVDCGAKCYIFEGIGLLCGF